ncbi:MAG: hypothetical protein R3E32_11170 [Chitinophagales bacterium]
MGEKEFERFFKHKDNVTFNIFEEVVFTPDGGYLLTGSTNVLSQTFIQDNLY